MKTGRGFQWRSNPACQFCTLRLDWPWFWKGGESLPSRTAGRGRKVRTPKGAMPRNSGSFGWDTRGRKVERLFDGQCHRKSNRLSRFAGRARVKRCGKSAPREAQATRHGKPHRVQGQIGNPGAARSRFRESETDSGYRPHRQMVLSTRKGADRIRLTALPRPISKASR